MDTLLIDKLLESVCTQEASELYLAVGSQPVIHLHGQVQSLATRVLDPDDTMALMKSITPERCQQEVQDVGRADFGFAFAERARFRVVVSKERGSIGLVVHRIPTEVPTDRLGGATPE
jgi:twitching motility protein PilT